MSLRTYTLLWLMRRIESGKQRGWKYQVMEEEWLQETYGNYFWEHR